MGGDGGVKATQKRFMRGYKNPEEKPETVNIRNHQRIRAQVCSLTSKPLVQPIVGCELGNLFNKEDILTSLINKTLNPAFSHIRGLKDLKTLRLTINPVYDNSREQHHHTFTETAPAKFICPVTGDELNGTTQFYYIWSTGYVLSDRCLRELGTERLQGEFGPFSVSDIVRINPTVEELELLKANMIARRAGRKDSKRKRDTHSDSVHGNTGPELSTSTEKMLVNDNVDDVNNAVPDEMNSRPYKVATQLRSTASSNQTCAAGASSNSGQIQARVRSSSQQVTQSATRQVSQQIEQSSVYRGLFHGDKEADKKDRDLFMSVAGLRYTLS